MDSDFRLILIAVPVLALSIAVHEMMHALTSDALGDDTARLSGRISINPFKHIDPITTVALPMFLLLAGLPPFGAARPVPFNPSRVKHQEFGVALIALAGPLTNLILAILAGLGCRLFYASAPTLIQDILILTLKINVGFFIFNLIPYPPLDGSRVLYAFAPEPVQKFMEQLEALGFSGIIIFMLLIFPFISPILSKLSENLLLFLT